MFLLWFALGVIALATAWAAGGDEAWGRLRLGIHTVRATNVFEAIEKAQFVGSLVRAPGGGFYSLPPLQQVAAAATVAKAIDYMKSFPPEAVTALLIRNSLTATGNGQALRVMAMDRLLEYLVEQGVAVPLDVLSVSSESVPQQA